MPAYFDTGFSVREPMWHGMGLVLDEYPSDWSDARDKAGLTWEPELRTAYQLRPDNAYRTCRRCAGAVATPHVGDDCPQDVMVQQGDCLPHGSVLTDSGIFVPVPDHRLVVRNDNEFVLGVRSNEFAAIYHGEEHAQQHEGASMEEIIDVFAGQSGVKFETAGSIREGRAVWALFYLDEPYTVPGDDTEHLPFFALLNPHDGTGAAKLINTQVRIVCWNTFQMASNEAEASGRQWTFRHVGDVAGRIDEAKAALAGLRTERDEYLALAKDLMALRVDDKGVGEFLSEFLPSPRENGEVCTDRVHENVERARATFRRIYTDSVTTDAVRGTSWGLLQASTEYLDHARAFRSKDTYLGRSILRTEPAKARALTLAREVGR